MTAVFTTVLCCVLEFTYASSRLRQRCVNAGCSRPAPRVTLLCLSKEESPEERTPRRRRQLPALLARTGARLNSPGAYFQHAPGARRSAARPFGGMEVHRTSMNTPPHPRARSKVSRHPRGGLRCSAAATGTRKTNGRGLVLGGSETHRICLTVRNASLLRTLRTSFIFQLY